MNSGITVSAEAREEAVVLGFPVRRGATVRQALREIRRGGPPASLSISWMRREDLEEEIFELWEG
jgi:hypothetical protein